MPFVAGGIPNRGSLDVSAAYWRNVGITAPKQKRYKIVWMIVKMWSDIRTNPMMNTNGIIEKNETPPIQIRRFSLTQHLPPPYLKRFEWCVFIHLKKWSMGKDSNPQPRIRDIPQLRRSLTLIYLAAFCLSISQVT